MNEGVIHLRFPTARPSCLASVVALMLAMVWPARAAEPIAATLCVDASKRSAHTIPKFITGKFAEHLGVNIYNGMDAQVLRNPTFADWPFWSGQMTPDGITKFQSDDEKVLPELRRQAERFGYPESELDALVTARTDALACFWTRVGPRDAVQTSPDTRQHGGRAQRVSVKAAGQGIAQWCWLPLHRVRKFEFELFVRSPEISEFTITLTARDGKEPCASAEVKDVTGEWRKVTGSLEVPADLPAESAYRFSVTARSAGQFVIGRALLRPADHINGADADVVRFLRESKLPILRWPGGNFVSAYHWEDGIGAFERRPSKPNYAWGGVESHLFGTHEFIAFCRAVGCEPMICVNAGTGTAEEAARWIEYCNGPATSPMGKLRAANGHPEPFNVKHWEVGNELWGKWQAHWTTAAGYVDRFKEFVKAMQAADPTIKLYACGAPVMWGKDWNDTLIAGAASILGTTTDHPLVGGNVPPSVEPIDVYRDFMAVPDVLEQKWAALRDDMQRGGVKEPRLAVTELQLFAHIGGTTDPNAPVRLTRDNLPGQASITEAIHDILVYHACVRLAPFVDMVTHSATVNHGGGLRKDRERVWANPCHYAQSAFAELAGATPVAIEIEAPIERAPLVLPDLRNVTKERSFKSIDAVAALAPNGDLLLSIVHRGTAGRIRLQAHFDGFKASGRASVRTLSADTPWAANTRRAPKAIEPDDSHAEVRTGAVTLEIQPYSVLRVRIPRNP